MTDRQIDDLPAFKARAKATWMAGDYPQIARVTEAAANDFIARLRITPGMKVLDVACGNGNLSIPAAKAGAIVTGVDIAPNLLDHARARAAAEGLDIRFEEGDAENLPYQAGTFDGVVSMFGAMFAPRPEVVADELVRVCRHGGRIALANWTPSGFVGELFRSPASMFRRPPACRVRCSGAMKPPCATGLAIAWPISGWSPFWCLWHFRIRCGRQSSSTAFITVRH